MVTNNLIQNRPCNVDSIRVVVVIHVSWYKRQVMPVIHSAVDGSSTLLINIGKRRRLIPTVVITPCIDIPSALCHTVAWLLIQPTLYVYYYLTCLCWVVILVFTIVTSSKVLIAKNGINFIVQQLIPSILIIFSFSAFIIQKINWGQLLVVIVVVY